MRVPEGNEPSAPGSDAPEGAGREDDRELESAAGVGPRVSALFAAAEQAADHILSMARAEAEDLRRHAEAEVVALRSQRRQDAEEEARMIVDGAQSEADEIRAQANAAARTVEDAARRRAEWIDEGIRLLMERAEWGRRGLSEIISRLEDFVVRHPTEWGYVPPLPTPKALGGTEPPERGAAPGDSGVDRPSAPPKAAVATGEAAGGKTDEEGFEAPRRARSPVADDPEPDDIPPLPSSPSYVERSTGGIAGEPSPQASPGGDGQSHSGGAEEGESAPHSEPGGDDPWRKGEDIYGELARRDDDDPRDE